MCFNSTPFNPCIVKNLYLIKVYQFSYQMPLNSLMFTQIIKDLYFCCKHLQNHNLNKHNFLAKFDISKCAKQIEYCYLFFSSINLDAASSYSQKSKEQKLCSNFAKKNGHIPESRVFILEAFRLTLFKRIRHK